MEILTVPFSGDFFVWVKGTDREILLPEEALLPENAL